jgi:hypothetical protein
VITWLGFVIDLKSFSLSITEKRLASAQKSLREQSRDWAATPRDRLRAVMKIVSMSDVLGPVCQLRTRFLLFPVGRVGMDTRVFLGSEMKEEIVFWRENLRALARRALLLDNRVKVRMSCDASSTGLGAVFETITGPLIASRLLTVAEQGESSTAREMRAIVFAVGSFARQLTEQRAILHCDNKGAVAIVAKGSPKPALTSLAIELADLCREIKCDLEVVWVPRELNSEADEASRLEDQDNWGILPAIFQVCQQKWGRFTVDRFADHENAKCPRFNSRYWVPNTEAVNCFGERWDRELNWVVPPIALIVPALNFMLASGAHGVLGVPEWPTFPFFPLLVDSNGHWKPFIADVLRLPIGAKLFQPDRKLSGAFGQRFANFPFLFIKIAPQY